MLTIDNLHKPAKNNLLLLQAHVTSKWQFGIALLVSLEMGDLIFLLTIKIFIDLIC